MMHSIIDTHENTSPITIMDSSKKVELPSTGEILLFSTGVLLVLGIGIIATISMILYKKIKIKRMDYL